MIETSAVGLPLPARDTTITVRRMLAFAAGIGDVSPAVFDDASPAFVAHPALCVSLEWAVIGDPAAQAVLVPDPADRLRAVHLVQDSTFHRPLRAGERVTTSGTVTGVWRGNAGARTACMLRSLDHEGLPVVTSRTVAVYRGVSTEGPDRAPSDEAPVPAAPEAASVEVFEVAIEIDPALPHRYSECAGIWNPIHTERRVARAAGLPDVVVHGTATWALAGTAIVKHVGGGDASRLRRLRGRFGALVFPGSRLLLKARSLRDPNGSHVHFEVTTPSGEAAIAEGYAFLSDEPVGS